MGRWHEHSGKYAGTDHEKSPHFVSWRLARFSLRRQDVWMRAIGAGAPMRRQLKADLQLMFEDFISSGQCRRLRQFAEPGPAKSPTSFAKAAGSSATNH